jgi:ribosomal-protein-alanine N-acetyltransferase
MWWWWWQSFFPWLRRPAPRFRLMHGHDAEQAAALHANSFARGWSDLEIARLISDPAVEANALEQERDLSAFVLSRIAADEAEILTIAVDPDCRGEGLGHQLLNAHLARLAARGVKNLFLEVEDDNRAARALYAKAGFEQVGTRQAYYARPDGSRGHALVLKLPLD